MTNVVFLVAIGNKTEYEVCKQSWKKWCDKHGVELVVLDQEIRPKEEMFYNFQRYYMFELLDNMGIDYDGVLTVDCDTLIHPNTPNFFETTDRDKLYMVKDNGSYDWIIRGLEWYKHLFTNDGFDIFEYSNSGFQLMGKKHKDFYTKMLELWEERGDEIIEISEKYGLGKEQAIWNWMIREHDIEYELLPYKYNMTNMATKEILNINIFTKLGWIYHFNGLEGKEEGSVRRVMEETYRYLNEIEL